MDNIPIAIIQVNTITNNFSEFTLSYRLCRERFAGGRIDSVEHEMYWMNKLPRPLHNAFLYILDVKYHSTVLYSTLAVFADNFRFQRVLWKSQYYFKIKVMNTFLTVILKRTALISCLIIGYATYMKLFRKLSAVQLLILLSHGFFKQISSFVNGILRDISAVKKAIELDYNNIMALQKEVSIN